MPFDPTPHRDIPGPEEELTVEVGLFDGVHVGDSDATLRATAQSHHCKVLQQLAADGPGPHLRPGTRGDMWGHLGTLGDAARGGPAGVEDKGMGKGWG